LDTLSKLRTQVEASSFFIQILEGSAGMLVPTEAGALVPILRLEMGWFLTKRHELGNRRPLPLVLSFKPTTTGSERDDFQELIQWMEEQGVGYEPCDHVNTAYKVANGWFARIRHLPTEISAIDGSLDIEVGNPTIDRAIEAAFVRGEPLSQKYLYTSPVAALLWLKLSRLTKTRTRDLYDTIDYSTAVNAPMKALVEHCAKLDIASPLSIIALGCGDARRESVLVRTLCNSSPQRKPQILLVDISKTLISHAVGHVVHALSHLRSEPAITFALADFEHPTAMASVMTRWRGDHPGILLLLGNTLGNIEATNFLQTIASAMKPKDLLAVEIAIANDKEREGAMDASKNRVWRNPSKQKDPTFEFVCGPIRALGISPQIDRYKVRQIATETAIEQHYAYHLTSRDMDDAKYVVGNTTFSEPRIELVKVASFFDDKLDVLFPDSLKIIAREIKSSGVMREGQAARMGFVVAERQG
jgi:hypothetical protein